MKKVIGLLNDYRSDHFNWRSFLLIFLLGFALIFFAYRNEFYLHFIEYEHNLHTQIFRYCLLYFIAFAGAYFLEAIGDNDFSFFRSGRWWFLVLFAVILFAVRGSDLRYDKLLIVDIDPGFYVLAHKIAYNLGGLLLIIIPCGLYWFFADRKQQPLYGFHKKGVNLQPYFILLALMLPLLLWAGTQPDFLATYPRYKHIGLPPGTPHYAWYVWLYEFAYGSDFVFTEFFFRGFLVLAFIDRFGHKAILPMCIFYITIHFGKPLGETISSFFGGWILGIIAWKTRSIYGGIIIHLGIAYLMEIIAIAGRHFYL